MSICIIIFEYYLRCNIVEIENKQYIWYREGEQEKTRWIKEKMKEEKKKKKEGKKKRK